VWISEPSAEAIDGTVRQLAGALRRLSGDDAAIFLDGDLRGLRYTQI
jgi:hypothetical protein